MQDSADPPVLFGPIADVPCPRIDLRALPDPVPAILGAPEFAETTRYFAQSPGGRRSLLTDLSQALLYTLIRNLRPAHVVEIGTYRGGTAESLSRALQANDFGTLHTVSPYDAERSGPIFARWPEELRRRTRYHPVDSMMFFMQIDLPPHPARSGARGRPSRLRIRQCSISRPRPAGSRPAASS